MAAKWQSDDFSWIRGMNYTPSYAPNDVVTWRDFDADVVDRELGLAEKLDLNSVRTWLQYIVYEHDPEKFNEAFETYLALCEKHGIRAMPILFDSCFGDEPSIDWNGHWVMSPGTSKEVPEYWPKLQKYVDDVVGKHAGDERVVMWDIMNEPTVRPLTVDFVKHWCKVVREMDPTHPVTVGVAGGVTMALPYADDEDVLSMHSYSAPAALLRAKVNKMKQLGDEKGKPVIITECCAPGWGQSYEVVGSVMHNAGIGWYAWDVTIGCNQFKAISGLLYPDGTCRRATEVAAIMDIAPEDVPFPEKPDSEGVPLVPVPDPPRFDIDEAQIDKMRRMVSEPTTPENLESRRSWILDKIHPISGLVRMSLDEIREAHKVFAMLGVLEKQEDDEAVAKELDKFIAMIVPYLGEIDVEALKE